MDISGDAGIRAYGNSIEELFINAAEGMYSLITDVEDIKEKREVLVEVESSSTEGLLVAWLNELIFWFDAYGFISGNISIIELRDNRLSARLTGEDFDLERHKRKLLIKAATYHRLAIERKGGQWEAGIIFDI